MANAAAKTGLSAKFAAMKASGKKIDPSIPLEEQNNVTLLEKISLILARIGGMFGTTLTGTLASTFLYELFFVGVIKEDGTPVISADIASMSAVQTTITFILGLAMPLIAGVAVQKWKSRWGRYRQWYIICLIPIFVLTVSFYWVPKGWTYSQMCLFRYILAALQTFFNAFNNLGQNIMQVITPNYKEKKSIATIWQISYYLGYGLAYLSPEIFKLFVPKGSENYSIRYLVLTTIAACFTLIGNLMCGLFCKERIELPKKEKALSKELITLFKYRNYRAYQYIQWVNVLAALGKWSTLLVGITVGSSNALLLTIPTAAGTVIGNLICGKAAKKFEPTKILKFCGFYSMAAAVLLFGVCYAEKCMGLYFWESWYAAFFYAFYFVFGIGVGLQELSTSHFSVEYFDYLEWQTGERLEAVQGIIPGWINSGITYCKDLLIPFIIAWIAYPTNDDSTRELIDVIQERIGAGTLTQEAFLNTCMWLLGLLVFGYALSNVFKALIIKFFYNVEGDTKVKMYKELEEMRAKRHLDNKGMEAAKENAPEIG